LLRLVFDEEMTAVNTPASYVKRPGSPHVEHVTVERGSAPPALHKARSGHSIRRWPRSASSWSRFTVAPAREIEVHGNRTDEDIAKLRHID
jgi:hypothetical protein